MNSFAIAATLLATLPLQSLGRPPASESSAPGSYLRIEDHRVGQIAYRIAVSGAPYCSAAHPLTGLLFHHIREYEPADQIALVKSYGLDRGLGILSVIEGSPAAQAGLIAGDVIVAVNGEPLRQDPALAPRQATARRALLEAAESQIEEELRKGPAELAILRNAQTLTARLSSIPGCPARVRLARSRQTNAFASGRYVTLTTAVLDFVQSDQEIAVIVGHELAHNILNHPDRLESEKVPRGFLRGIGRNADKVRATEEEADALGIRLVWAAGYDPAAAIPFWRRYYARFDGPQLFRTHPTLAARERLIAATVAELNRGAERPELGKGPLPDR